MSLKELFMLNFQVGFTSSKVLFTFVFTQQLSLVKLLLQCVHTIDASVHDPSAFSLLSFLSSFKVGSLLFGRFGDNLPWKHTWQATCLTWIKHGNSTKTVHGEMRSKENELELGIRAKLNLLILSQTPKILEAAGDGKNGEELLSAAIKMATLLDRDKVRENLWGFISCEDIHC